MSNENTMLYDAQKKSLVVAFLLWLVFGLVGAHRFYLGDKGIGLAQLVWTLFALFGLHYIGLHVAFPIALAVAWITAGIDGFFIPSTVRDANTELAHNLSYRD